MYLAGAIDSPASDKAARFISLCDAHDIPIVILCDTPGLMVGPEVETTGLVRHSARILVALANATVPFMTVVLRKAYGLGYYVMGSRPLDPTLLVAWPTAEFGGMGIEGAVNIIHKKELEAESDPAKRAALHALPAPGKSGGAYQDGVYGAPPFVFLNHQGEFESVSTFAHEWGHAMHTAMANRAQPYETANYSLFIAEIASTANEVLLSHYMQGQARSKEEKLYQLGYALERLRATFFRQAMFGEFELNTHDAAAKGEALNGKRFTEMYCKLLKEYHGDAAGVMKIDPLYCQEWAFIPHFYRPFYVYQYATSITAALHFAEDVLAAKPGARDNYLKLLASGGSMPPYEALKKAGLDMASPAPYRAVIQRMDRLMDEMEALLAAK